MGSAAEVALNGAWEFLVELRTGFPEIRSAFAASDDLKAGRSLDRLVAKARKVGPLLIGWPTIIDDVSAAVSQLKADHDSHDAWRRLMTLADELEEAIAHETTQHTLSEDEPS